MLLYTCPAKVHAGSFGHPCGYAAKALDEAGHAYEVKAVPGFKNIPFMSGGGKRDEIVQLTGNKSVPVLLLDDGTFVQGSKEIAAWATDNAPS